MNKDKSLSVTKRDSIFRGEYNVNSVIFYIPKIVDNVDISQADITAIFELPDDDIIIRTLMAEESEYTDYLKYSTTIDSEITVYSGRVNVAVKIMQEDSFLLKGKPTKFFIESPEPRCSFHNYSH